MNIIKTLQPIRSQHTVNTSSASAVSKLEDVSVTMATIRLLLQASLLYCSLYMRYHGNLTRLKETWDSLIWGCSSALWTGPGLTSRCLQASSSQMKPDERVVAKFVYCVIGWHCDDITGQEVENRSWRNIQFLIGTFICFHWSDWSFVSMVFSFRIK